MIHKLDKELEKQGLKYVRYGDDSSIYTKNKSTARKTGNAVFLYLKNKLKLPINREKSGLRKPVQFTTSWYLPFVPFSYVGTNLCPNIEKHFRYFIILCNYLHAELYNRLIKGSTSIRFSYASLSGSFVLLNLTHRDY